jgi:hypothetical protein
VRGRCYGEYLDLRRNKGNEKITLYGDPQFVLFGIPKCVISGFAFLIRPVSIITCENLLLTESNDNIHITWDESCGC